MKFEFNWPSGLMTLASTVFKKSTFQKISHLNALGRKFDLDVK